MTWFIAAAAVLMVCIAIRAERRVATAGLGILDVRRRRFALGCGARPSEEVMRDWRRSAVSRVRPISEAAMTGSKLSRAESCTGRLSMDLGDLGDF